MIATQPPPKLEKADLFSSIFSEFISQCLKTEPKERPNADELLQVDLKIFS